MNRDENNTIYNGNNVRSLGVRDKATRGNKKEGEREKESELSSRENEVIPNETAAK